MNRRQQIQVTNLRRELRAEKQMRKKGYKKGTSAYKEVERCLREGGLL